MNLRRSAQLAAALSAAVLVAGCGGGGGGGESADSASATPASGVAVTPAAGVAAAPTDALFGTPEAVDASNPAGSLDGYEEFGTPRDAFVQVVSDEGGGGGTNEAASGAVTAPTSSLPPAPVTTTPIVPVTPVTPGTPSTPTTPTTTVEPPVNAPPLEGYEADFDIGGEPVVARVGDAIPPETQQFTVKDMTTTKVVLKLNGGLLPDGSDTVTLTEGQSLTLVNQTTRTTYRLRLLDIRRV